MMVCRSIIFSIYIFVTVATATNFSDRNSLKGSDPEVTVHRFKTGNTESSTVERGQEVNETTAVLLQTPSEARNLSQEEKNRRLIQAAKEGAIGDLQALLASGADVRARDSDLEWTALHWAAFWGHVEVVRWLVGAGAEVDARNDYEATPLHFAAGSDRVAVVRVLTASSADPNAKDDEEQTPLHWAAERGYADTVRALLEAGADKEARDVRGSSPLDLARANDHQQLVDILRSS
ncbi:CARD- and ANK-domain containing inflammasome adapter protein-like [Schistocerca serialis cubense]|uniref:CARD- and ANK-domain containing inflammasome adapter protein-like n=1 Tax=Schistocerca serialis cubense TaxID=2023355 RepID=UPI00214E9689|nr:CARD- and ANK-domain containing inflammasome adapter protein-like [Schistocerca serialis cubense]